jgi:hypothetical protein
MCIDVKHLCEVIERRGVTIYFRGIFFMWFFVFELLADALLFLDYALLLLAEVSLILIVNFLKQFRKCNF